MSGNSSLQNEIRSHSHNINMQSLIKDPRLSLEVSGEQSLSEIPEEVGEKKMVSSSFEQEPTEKNNIGWYILGGALLLGGGVGLASSRKGNKKEIKEDNFYDKSHLDNSTNLFPPTVPVKPTLPEIPKVTVKPKPIAFRSFQYSDHFFKQDSDKDGFIDAIDPNANSWNVSNRDLRTFSTLAYKNETILDNIFNKKHLQDWNLINNDSETGFGRVFSEQESQNFIHSWELLYFQNTGDFIESGLDYAIFGNGRKSDGSYHNMVVAFRGAKRQLLNLQDFFAAIKGMNGNLPTQAREIQEQLLPIIQKYKPDMVYTTGHSLGGYLAQYFAGYVMQNSAANREKMQHSAIFNPLRLIINDDSLDSLKIARSKTEHFVKQGISQPDISNPNPLYKTNSYVINGEFLADGVPTIEAVGGGGILGGLLSLVTGGAALPFVIGGAVAGGLAASKFSGYGAYPNTVRFTPEEKGGFDGHKMIRFYEKTDALISHFSAGSRRDDWKKGNNPYLKDSDGDGIPDIVEQHFGSNWLDANSRLAISQFKLNNQLDNTQNQEIVLHYQMDTVRKGNYISTTPSQLTEHIYANDYDNRIDGGQGNNVLFGGKGRDIFVLGTNDFKHNQLNTIGDFSAKEDKLDLSALKAHSFNLSKLFNSTDSDYTHQSGLVWNPDKQELGYQHNHYYVLAKFLNDTELTMQNLIT